MDDVAIVGIGCRYSGEATDPRKLWELLASGKSTWSEIPKSRFNNAGFYHPNPERKGTTSVKGGHFMKDSVATFDPTFFDIPVQAAPALDPQQRLALEIVYEALENAGIPKESLQGTQTAVFLGAFVKDYEQLVLRDPDSTPHHAATGTQSAILANGLSYWLDVRGPSMTIETGCSSSLIAVHQACQSLRTYESDIGIAGGVSLILTADMMFQMTDMHFLGPNGKCFAFSAEAEGYGRGEGCGIVVLKRLQDAVRNNDTIRGVIRGSAVNSDGRTPGITMPNEHAQDANIKRAYRMAGLQVSDTNFVECHGTGTKQGDNHEAKAIAMSFAKNNKGPVYIGSVKTNIGHTEAAAGVAGLIKAALALEHGEVPQHLNYTTQSPDIPLDDWNMRIPLERIAWPSEIMRASVNSFGFGGANAHVIVDGAAQYLDANQLQSTHHGKSTEQKHHALPSTSKEVIFPSSKLYVYSAHDDTTLEKMLKDHAAYLKGLEDNANLLADYSYTLNSRRSRLEHTITLISASKQDLLTQLDEVDDLKTTPISSRKARPNVCYVFCGQGSCRPGMFNGLLPFPPFRRSVDAGREVLRQIAPEVDFAAAVHSQEQAVFDSPVVAQVATTLFQVALVDLLATSGINPVTVAGHSSGEIAAAYAARIIDHKTALNLAYLRGKAATTAPPGGGMLAAAMSVDAALGLLDHTEVADSVTIGCINSPSSVTFSGATTGLGQLAKQLRAHTGHKIRRTMLKVPIAYHSSYMVTPAKIYLESIPSYTPRNTSATRMFSSVTGEEVFASDLTPTYWEKSMQSPVLFDSALMAMMTDTSATTADILIELSPTSVLQTSILETLLSAGFLPGQVKQLTMQDNAGNNLQSLALPVLSELILSGVPINMDWMVRPDGDRPKCLIDLPPYPWNHSKTYWHESQESVNRRNRSHGREDLIGAPATQLMDLEPRWTGSFRLHENPWIKDHQIQRLVMYPAAGMVVMAVEGAKQLSERMASHAQRYSYEVSDIDIMAPMLIPSTQRGLDHTLSARRLASATTESGSSSFSFNIYSCLDVSDWQKNAKGSFKIIADPQPQRLPDYSAPDNILDLSTGGAKPHHLYEHLDGMGMRYGRLFRAITSIGAVKVTPSFRSCWVRLEIPHTAQIMPFNYEHDHIIHPATLDAIIHSVFALQDKPRMPIRLKSVLIASNFPKAQGSELFAHCSATGIGTANVTADVAVYDAPEAAPILQVRGLQLAPLPSAADSGFLPNYRNLCSTVEWNVDPVEHLPEDTMENFLGWFRLLLLKKPDLQVLFAVDDISLAKQMLALIVEEVDYAITCSRFTLMGVAQHNHTAIMNSASPKLKAVLPILEARESVTEMADLVSTYDVAVVDVVQIQKLKEFVKRGSFLYEQQSQTVIANDAPLVTVEKNVKLLVVVLVTEKLQVSAQFGAFSARMFDALQTEFPNSEVSLTTDLNLEQYEADETHVVSFLDLDVSRDVSLNADEYYATQKLLLSKSYKSLLWVTRGAQLDCSTPKAAAAIGIIRTIRSEEPSQQITCFDLDAADESHSLAEDHLIPVLKDCIHHARAQAGRTPVLVEPEAEYAVKDGILYFQRLKPMTALNRLIESDEDEPASEEPHFLPQMRVDATYLIVGGLGGLGQEVARRLVARGARHLCFVSRRNAPGDDKLEMFAHSFGKNVVVKMYQADVCDASKVREVLGKMKTECPPLKGVIQAAAVLKDARFGNITHDMYNAAYRPKAAGANNLHELLPNDLDFVVLMSSAAGIIGNRAQAGYNAGNCVQDAIARRRTLTGSPTVSLDIGPVIEAGMLADDADLLALLAKSGFNSVRIEHVLAMFEWAVAECLGLVKGQDRSGGQIVAGVGTGGLLAQNKPLDPFWARQTVFAVLNRVDLPARAPGTASQTNQSDAGSGSSSLSPKAVVSGIRDHLVSTGVLEAPHDALAEDRNFSIQGVDSRAAAALASWVVSEWGVVVSVGELLGESSVGEIAGRVVERLAVAAESQGEAK